MCEIKLSTQFVSFIFKRIKRKTNSNKSILADIHSPAQIYRGEGIKNPSQHYCKCQTNSKLTEQHSCARFPESCFDIVSYNLAQLLLMKHMRGHNARPPLRHSEEMRLGFRAAIQNIDYLPSNSFRAVFIKLEAIN